jgi:hypothetical protein
MKKWPFPWVKLKNIVYLALFLPFIVDLHTRMLDSIYTCILYTYHQHRLRRERHLQYSSSSKYCTVLQQASSLQ